MVKEQLVIILRNQGYDIITACEVVSEFIKTTLSKLKPGKYIFYIGKEKVTIKKQ